ncbi:protein DMR6-LIKE OXYGENASE 1 [Citrus sinensis]|uniref:Protein DMR6-LIKE OXYGENASE 1 n=1 Tax=Citrus sinensis TaxID=2711 RepID=A0ACB8HUD3_CITSI|nr:protein DMR6-LIKE OXYGENASE 1 [Citrus sinensis]
MAAATTKLLLSDLASTVESVTSNYIRPISDRPNLTEVQISDGSIPLIDLQVLDGPRRLDLIKQIGQACHHDGFFQDCMHEWPSNPPSFEVVAEYCTSVRGLVLKLLEAISESMGLQRDYIDKALGKHGQQMALNYCPPCPQPDLTYGLPGHTDPNLITVLLQDDVMKQKQTLCP